MSELIDLTGQRFGRLTVTGRAMNRGHAAMWDCVCDCGGTATVASTRLRQGWTQSCGCLRKETPHLKGPADLTGLRFGKLTVVRRNASMRGRAAWDCACDCGNTATVSRSCLLDGTTKSCGCARYPSLDLVGQQFGHYTVIGGPDRTSGRVKWVCRCDCGAVVERTTWQLGTSAGNCHRGCPLPLEVLAPRKTYRPRDDLSGLQFGRLHVLSFDEEATKGQLANRAMWVCRCECGTIKSVRANSLVTGRSRSCGSYACRQKNQELALS